MISLQLTFHLYQSIELSEFQETALFFVAFVDAFWHHNIIWVLMVELQVRLCTVFVLISPHVWLAYVRDVVRNT